MVAAGGVENWESHFSASVAFDGVGNQVVFVDVAAAIIRTRGGR